MEVLSCAITDLKLLTPRHIGDERGYFAEVFRADLFAQHVGDYAFVQDNESRSAKVGTIRGLHFQSNPHAQGKLVRCTAGALFDVAVDIRAGSPTYGQWVGETLTPTMASSFGSLPASPMASARSNPIRSSPIR